MHLHERRGGRGAGPTGALAALAALLVSALAGPASANNATPLLFGPELLRSLGGVLVVVGAVGVLLGLGTTALSFSRATREAVGSSLAVFARGVVATMGLGTLFVSTFLVLLGVLFVADAPWLGGPLVFALAILPGIGALLLAGELVYTGLLYRRVHQARGDGASRVLGTLAYMLVVPCVIVALLFGALGVSLALDQLAPGHDLPGGVLVGIGGILLSALAGMGGLALVLAGKVRSTTAIVVRGTAMFLSVGVFVIAAAVLFSSAEALATSGGATIAPQLQQLAGFGTAGLTSFLLGTELGIGAALHWHRADERDRPLQRAVGFVSLALSVLFGGGAAVMVLLGALAVL